MTTPPSSSRLWRTIFNRSPSLSPNTIVIHSRPVRLAPAPQKFGPPPAPKLLCSQAHHIVLYIFNVVAPQIHVPGRALICPDDISAIDSRRKSRETTTPGASRDAVCFDGLYDDALNKLAHSIVLHG
mmetsp:Transcript_22209/g.33778  ORF Transcript_22209/g.33778 Transcript_22209/m.33778 type:complete len:127 (-) Transcript_22209:411-791(-)